MESVPPSEYEIPPVFDMVTSAVSYTARNRLVILVHTSTAEGLCSCRNEQCSSVGKHPRTRNGVKDASKEYAKILEWWQRDPGSNVGIATGNGLLVIDIDPRHGGTLKALDGRFNLPLTARVRMGGGGWHLYYHYNPRIYTLPNTAGKLGEGLDSRGENGYVLAPPSRHVSGKRYSWSMDGPVANAPVRLLVGQQPVVSRAWITLHQRVRLVVIDTLARVRPTGTGQVYADDYAVVTPLKQLAEQYHVAILLIHHLRKNGATDVMDEVSGTTGLTGATDCIMVLQRERGQQQATLTITGRDMQDQALNLSFSETTAHWSIKPSRDPILSQPNVRPPFMCCRRRTVHCPQRRLLRPWTGLVAMWQKPFITW